MSEKVKNSNNHEFHLNMMPSWCDFCDEFMWRFSNNRAYKCVLCKYACHERCIDQSNFACPSPAGIKDRASDNTLLEVNSKTTKSNSKNFSSSIAVKPPQEMLAMEASANLSKKSSFKSSKQKVFDQECENFFKAEYSLSIDRERICKIAQYYNQLASTDVFEIIDDEAKGRYFSGFLRIQINLKRPVNVIAENTTYTLKRALSKRGRTNTVTQASSFSALKDPQKNNGEASFASRTRTADAKELAKAKNSNKGGGAECMNDSEKRQQQLSRKQTFSVPYGYYAPINADSLTTTERIIQKLLAKYDIVANPIKYALFIRRKNENKTMDEGFAIRLNSTDYPLRHLLHWGPFEVHRFLSLEENDSYEAMWDYFTKAELNNFLTILNNEEEEMLKKAREKFDSYKGALIKLLK